jgi:signal transduction histidine kinase
MLTGHMRLPFTTTAMQRPFWQALALAGALIVAALIAMALSLALSLGQADRLLDRLSRSQDQLAMVTRIEADIGNLRADTLAGEPVRNGATDAVFRQLEEYRQSIVAEGGVAEQSSELQNAARLTELFQALSESLPSAIAGGSPTDRLRFDTARSRFDELAGRIIANERLETRAAIGAMRDLRRDMTLLGVAIPLLVAVLGAIGAGIMLASMLRPLRVLEEAARRAGRGERVSPVRIDGFAEFQQLAGAFNHMDEQIGTQREALSAANRNLEADVAERTRDIEASRAKLAEIDRTRRLFFSQIGHELRTPATVIRGEAEIALRDGEASAARLREALEHVVANGDFLQRRLEDMMALARAEDGRIALMRERIDLGDLVRKTAQLAEPYLRSSGARLETEFADGGRPMIVGDGSWIQQGLLALVDNAAKFSGLEGAIRLSFSVKGKRAIIAVSDSGPGVEAADLPFLFESYYQTTVGRARGGSGLGLAVARWVVEQHGGKITATSGLEAGLTVKIELPVAS